MILRITLLRIIIRIIPVVVDKGYYFYMAVTGEWGIGLSIHFNIISSICT